MFVIPALSPPPPTVPLKSSKTFLQVHLAGAFHPQTQRLTQRAWSEQLPLDQQWSERRMSHTVASSQNQEGERENINLQVLMEISV